MRCVHVPTFFFSACIDRLDRSIVTCINAIITARNRSLGQGNVFYTCLSVILFTGGATAQLHAGIHPWGRQPLGQTPPWTDTPGQTPAGQTLPPPEYYGVWSTSARYSSYWNAYLLLSTNRLNLCRFVE